jgi:hypothetical protein
MVECAAGPGVGELPLDAKRLYSGYLKSRLRTFAATRRRNCPYAGPAARPGHVFWPDDISFTDAAVFDHDRLQGPIKLPTHIC